jgi:hypothetical protein
VEEAPRIEKSLALLDKNEPHGDFQNDSKGLYVQEDLSPESAQARISQLSEQVQSEVKRRNQMIDSTNADCRSMIADVITRRHSKLKLQNETIAKLAQVIPIELRAEPSAPIVPLKKKKEIAINPPRSTAAFQSRIKPQILNAIIDILIRG